MHNPPIESIKGIGEKKANRYKRMGLYTFKDVLYQYPFRYIDRRDVKHVHDIQSMNYATVKCKVMGVREHYLSKRKSTMVIVDVHDSFSSGEIVFFSKYMLNAFTVGEFYHFFGKIERNGSFFKIAHPEFAKADDKRFLGIVPIYPLTQGMTQKEITDVHRAVLHRMIEEVEETIPESIRHHAKICDIKTALANIHFPQDEKALKVARFRLIYEELLMLQLKLIILKRNYHKSDAPRFALNEAVVQFIDGLPFKLTGAQDKTLEAIMKDFDSGYAMNRLIQGDVGSGKTIVALIALMMAVENGTQGILMAPTTVLAEQHYQSFKGYLGDKYKIALLSSAVKAKEKKVIKNQIEKGEIDIVIATHAVIQDDVTFSKLGLVVTDEQHRFGVRARLTATLKGHNPHTMIMSATPIPRTLSLILHGDMDISIMNELPAGRKEIKTHFVKGSRVGQMYDFIQQEVDAGRQAYFVCPLVEDSEALDLQSATGLFEDLSMRYPNFKVGLVHGKMKNNEKDEVMTAFKENKIQILVSTTVIEVGINVPNATTMVIVNTERFGLSQLHQLRGRVGRGNDQSYCFLLSEKLSREAKQRIETMVSTNDGFVIADKDLEMRGPGEIFGVRQHGLPELKLANLVKHQRILEMVQDHVKLIMKEHQMNNAEIVRFISRICDNIEESFTL